MPTLDKILESGIFAQASDGSVSSSMVSLQEQLTAQRFAKDINSGRLNIKDAYRHFWSYEEDPILWKLAKDKEWRALLPDWKKIIECLTPLLEENPALEIYDIADQSYRSFRRIDSRYNPFEEDHDFIIECVKNNRLASQYLTYEYHSLNYRPRSDNRDFFRHESDEEEDDLTWLESDYYEGILESLKQHKKHSKAADELFEKMEFKPPFGDLVVVLLRFLGKYERWGVLHPRIIKLLDVNYWEDTATGFSRENIERTMLGYLSITTRSSVINTLGHLGYMSPEIIDMAFNEHETKEDRNAAVNAIIDSGKFERPVEDYLTSPGIIPKVSCLKIMRKLGMYHEIVGNLANDASEEVRSEALLALAATGRYHENMIRCDEEGIKDKERDSRIKALGMLRIYDPILIDCLFEMTPSKRRKLKRGLRPEVPMNRYCYESLISAAEHSHIEARRGIVDLQSRQKQWQEYGCLSTINEIVSKIHECLKPQGYLPPECNREAA